MTIDELELWPGGSAPGTGATTQVERDGPSPFVGTVRYNVTRPRLDVYRPAGVASGAAAIIAPGGGFHFLTMDNEGTALSDVLTAEGVTCFVLSYRLIATPADAEEAKAATMSAFMNGVERIEPFVDLILPDGPQAVRTVRAHAERYGVDPTRVSMIGFSAGARLTAHTTLAPDADARPNAAAIVYLPTMPPCEAPADAPPMFILAATDDQIGTTGNEDLYLAWRRAGRPVELHMFERGGHGFGMNPSSDLPLAGWEHLLIRWLRSHSML